MHDMIARSSAAGAEADREARGLESRADASTTETSTHRPVGRGRDAESRRVDFARLPGDDDGASMTGKGRARGRGGSGFSRSFTPVSYGPYDREGTGMEVPARSTLARSARPGGGDPELAAVMVTIGRDGVGGRGDYDLDSASLFLAAGTYGLISEHGVESGISMLPVTDDSPGTGTALASAAFRRGINATVLECPPMPSSRRLRSPLGGLISRYLRVHLEVDDDLLHSVDGGLPVLVVQAVGLLGLRPAVGHQALPYEQVLHTMRSAQDHGSSAAVRNAAARLYSLMLLAPCPPIDLGRPAKGSLRHDDRDEDSSDKHRSWKYNAVLDISQFLPEWKERDPIMAWHASVASMVQGPEYTVLRLLLQERLPTSVFLDALLRRAQGRHAVARVFQSARGVQNMDSLRVTVAKHFPDVVQCRGEMTEHTRRRAELCFKYILAALRAAYRNTGVMAAVAAEALALLLRLGRRSSEAEQEYLLRMDTIVGAHFDLWGSELTRSVSPSSLSQLVPLVVVSLEPKTQQEAIKACQNYLKEGSRRLEEDGGAPLVTPDMHDMMPMAPSNTEVAAIADAETSLGGVKFASAQDLYLLASACSLRELWAHLMQVLMGPGARDTYTAALAAPTDVFITDVHDLDEEYSDAGARHLLAVEGERRRRAAPGQGGRPMTEAALDKRVTRVVESGQRVTHQTGEKLEQFQRSIESMLREAEQQRQVAHSRSQEELAHQIRTIQEALANLATAATDVKHQRPLQEAAGEAASRARALERPSALPPTASPAPYSPYPDARPHATPRVAWEVTTPVSSRRRSASPHVVEVDGTPPPGTGPAAAASPGIMLASSRPTRPERSRGAPSPRRRPASLDEHGYKLWDKPDAVWDEIVDELRAWYADTHGVRTKEEFAAIADRTCSLCPRDWHNMPHRMKHCPSQNAGFVSGIQRLGKADAARILSRALNRHRDAASVTIAEVLQAAAELDAEGGPGGNYDACVFYCDWCGDDDDADTAFAQYQLSE